MASIHIDVIRGDEIPNFVFKDVSDLVSQHYGVWSNHPAVCPSRIGKPIRWSPHMIRTQYLRDHRDFLVRASLSTHSGVTVGHAICTVFETPSGECRGLWISQLVVRNQWRCQGIAHSLVKAATKVSSGIHMFGIASTCPVSMLALENVCPHHVKIRDHDRATSVLDACGVPYLSNRSVKPLGRRLLVNTEFFVQHPTVNWDVINQKTENSDNFLPLPVGHEYLSIIAKDNATIISMDSREEKIHINKRDNFGRLVGELYCDDGGGGVISDLRSALARCATLVDESPVATSSIQPDQKEIPP